MTEYQVFNDKEWFLRFDWNDKTIKPYSRLLISASNEKEAFEKLFELDGYRLDPDVYDESDAYCVIDAEVALKLIEENKEMSLSQLDDHIRLFCKKFKKTVKIIREELTVEIDAKEKK